MNHDMDAVPDIPQSASNMERNGDQRAHAANQEREQFNEERKDDENANEVSNTFSQVESDVSSDEEEENGRDCAICLSKVENQSDLFMLPCFHQYVMQYLYISLYPLLTVKNMNHCDAQISQRLYEEMEWRNLSNLPSSNQSNRMTLCRL